MPETPALPEKRPGASAQTGYVMAFDFGLAETGVAVGQAITGSARGVATLICRAGKPRWPEVTDLIEEFRPSLLLVGLPLNMDGTTSPISEAAEAFADKLRSRFELPVETHDERLTTRMAKADLEEAREMGRAGSDHELAACLIAESWMRENAREA